MSWLTYMEGADWLHSGNVTQPCGFYIGSPLKLGQVYPWHPTHDAGPGSFCLCRRIIRIKIVWINLSGMIMQIA